MIRTQLLIKYGGVWADPTVYFCRALDNWLRPLLGSGLFVFQKPGRDRLISNWFIAASPDNIALRRLYDALTEYWRTNDFHVIGHSSKWHASVLSRIINRNLDWPRLWLKKPFINRIKIAPYMIYHYIFYDLVKNDPECGRIWRSMPEVKANVATVLLRHGLVNKLSTDLRISLDEESTESPLYKLKWKIDSWPPPESSVLDYLMSREYRPNGFDK